ncbi:MAG: 50S ribosomal protein L3 [Armatimonadota bacterium]
MKGILGKKIGMMNYFTQDGELIPVTVISAGPCVITQVKTDEKDGYNAVQIGYEKKDAKRTNKPYAGHFKKNKLDIYKHLKEIKVPSLDDLTLGKELKISELFKIGDFVDISGTTIGKGFTGTMKRHNFAGQGASHGTSKVHRKPASAGSTDSARTFKGQKGPGQMGNSKSTILGLKVVQIDQDKNLILVKGSVPGHKNGMVFIRKSVKSKA